MMREAFLSPSKRHFDRSCGVVIVLVRYNARSVDHTDISERSAIVDVDEPVRLAGRRFGRARRPCPR